MADVIRAALVQASWTGDKESMIKAHEDTLARRPRRARR
jgi:N-carbamoylputrescine amidase